MGARDERDASYGAAHAAAWHKWFHIIEVGAQAPSERMVALGALEPGHRVLDLATGLGEPAVTGVRRVGPSGPVVAIDLSADMLAFARQGAEELGLGNIDYQEMDGLALAERSFDAVLADGVFSTDPWYLIPRPRARRVRRPSGRSPTPSRRARLGGTV